MKKLLILGLASLGLAGCAQLESEPLIFAQGVTGGVSVGQSPTTGAPELTIGVKTANIAVVPTIIPGDIELEQGHDRRIVSFGDTDDDNSDALSTFGSFSAEGEPQKVGLGIFFATGVAAQNLSEGFACGVSTGRLKDCNPAVTPPTGG